MDSRTYQKRYYEVLMLCHLVLTKPIEDFLPVVRERKLAATLQGELPSIVKETVGELEKCTSTLLWAKDKLVRGLEPEFRSWLMSDEFLLVMGMTPPVKGLNDG